MGPFWDRYPHACLLHEENFSLLGHQPVPKINLIRGVRKCRKKGKQSSKPNNNSLVIKQSQGRLVPPQGLYMISWAISFELFCRYWNLGWKKLTVCCPLAQRPQAGWNQKVDDMSPDCFTTNQSECPRANHAPHNPLPHPVFKNLSPKAIREFGSFEH